MIRLVALLLALALPAQAEEIVLGLSAEEVAITATFDGSDILIFGAVKRDAPPPPVPLQVIITVSGPLTPVTVREKERIAGIWVNNAAVEVDAAPSFYAVATTGPLSDILTDTEDLRHSITIPRAIRSVGHEIENSGDFTEALIRIRTQEGTYRLMEGAVELDQETLFRTSVDLPANLVEGIYLTSIYLTRGGVVVDDLSTVITVQKVGLERWLFNLSRDMPFVYGILSLVLAAVAGWAASAAAQAIRR